jgi:hypothetical protein
MGAFGSLSGWTVQHWQEPRKFSLTLEESRPMTTLIIEAFDLLQAQDLLDQLTKNPREWRLKCYRDRCGQATLWSFVPLTTLCVHCGREIACCKVCQCTPAQQMQPR